MPSKGFTSSDSRRSKGKGDRVGIGTQLHHIVNPHEFYISTKEITTRSERHAHVDICFSPEFDDICKAMILSLESRIFDVTD